MYICTRNFNVKDNMAAVSSYPQKVETNIYWNLLKDLDEDLKIQLVTRLKKSLSTKEVAKASVTDEAQKAYVVMLDKLKTYQAYPVGWDGEDNNSSSTPSRAVCPASPQATLASRT